MHIAAHKRRPGLHSLERWFLGVVLLQLTFMPLAFGAVHIWSQWVSFGLAAMGFMLAIWPRNYRFEEFAGVSPQFSTANLKSTGTERYGVGFNGPTSAPPIPPSIRLLPWPRLRRFPIFWLGLLLLGLLMIQVWNPSWVWTRNATSWWLVRVNDIPWLPTSIDAPFARFNAWRHLLIYATVWLTVCGLWIGITRRRSLHILLGSLVANACILGLVGFAHKASGEAKVLWLREFPGAFPFASFVYRNHAGAYFSLMGFVALGLAVWHFFDGRKRMARSTPAALWLISSFLLVFAVVFSLSRGAIIGLVVFGLAAVFAVVMLRFSSATRSTTPPIITAIIVVAIVATLGWMVRQIDFSAVYFRFERLSKLQANEPNVLGRTYAREAAIKMYADYWVRGVGAGGFRHMFPEYIKNKPVIYEGGTLFWEHAHNDWLEIPIELGVVGTLLLAGAVGWIGLLLVRGGWKNPIALMIALGAGQVLLNALMDFPFQNPAILVTWWALLIIGLRWRELDGGSGSAR